MVNCNTYMSFTVVIEAVTFVHESRIDRNGLDLLMKIKIYDIWG
ncbi:MAG: hypothetical protein WA323_25475 [Candidatus Nitrosopolaris sp.]